MNDTLETYLGQVYDVPFMNETGDDAHKARVRVLRIVEELWMLYSAAQHALTRAMAENRTHSEALDRALDNMELDNRRMTAAAEEIRWAVTTKLRELEGSDE